MKVIRSNVLGFCMGVRRAVDMASEEAQSVKDSGARVFTLGPLIHNPEVLYDLKIRGVEELPQGEENIKGCSLIVRAHGVAPQLENSLRDKGAHIVDATCPRVKASQLKAEELARAGYSLFLAGEASHAEIEGILGYVQSAGVPFCVVVDNPADAGKEAKKLYRANHDIKTALLGQSTISEELYRSIGEAIGMFFPNLEIVQTICASTKDRQQAIRDLLKEVDAVIIAGGKKSANTNRLLDIVRESGKPCVLVEKASDIPPEFKKYKTVGLSAGASTPDSIVDGIERELKKR
ncbi:MAG: 4-hydroxy-3-methylbut-2-enyl diphosphate reductase [Treponema sp.]|jgi:4-hydroxy-3-methylbut-2-enyl diphosphate reductase|nr:4-hydroxy-3-methylbut-2-enyl diphosphate reductase [Treponema sp.]